jgi:hemolysin activation/secretion protein
MIAVGLPCPRPGAQAPPVGDPTLRSGDRPPVFREEPRPAPGQVLPPVTPPPSPGPLEPLPSLRVFAREIRVVGSTAFSAEELRRVTDPYINREVTAEDLEALRVALTYLYVNRGYVTSGAILPDQRVSEGVITYRIVEGRLTAIDIQGNRWFRDGYLRDRLALAGRPPVDVNALQRRLQILLDDPRIGRLNADLRPGLRAGEAFLDVKVEDRLPFKLWLDVNNHQSPAVGAERGFLTLEHQNLTGNGDVLTLRYGRSEGLDPLLDVRYAVPVTPWDTIASFQYRRNTFTVVEEPFDEIDIESESEIFTLATRQPVYRTPAAELALELIGERLSHQTTLLGERFTLTPGARDGESIVTAVRFAQEFLHRSQNQVIAARSRFSVGLDALGSTVHGESLPDSQFFAWLGQFQWVRRLGALDALGLADTQLIFRTDVQLADDSLLTLEQVPVGGRFSVRGYRENTLVRDNAFLASFEFRLPVVQNVAWADYIQLAPFVDYARAWQSAGRTPEPRYLASVGVGLRWAVTIRSPFALRPAFEIYWGHPLRDVPTPEGDLQDRRNWQDEGVHFQFVLAAF